MTVNQQTLEGNWNEIKGMLRSHWGQLSGDDLESVHGDVEKLVGAIQRKTGEARESIEKYLEEITNGGASAVSQAAEAVRAYAETAQDSVQDATQQASDAVKAGYKKTEETIQKRPVESVAVCFGVGLITGVVIGLVLRSR